MSFVDKLKNALFEVEYVTVDNKDDEAKEKKKKQEENKDKPIAKRVILSGHREKRVKEDTPKTDDVKPDSIDNIPDEVPVGEEPQEESKQNGFKVMNDNDFKVEDFPPEPVVEKKEEPVYEKVIPEEKPVSERVIYRQEGREKAPYGIDEASKNLVQDYGRAYEKKEDRGGFKPSPIISPIYGVLDKNYKKEDVREKKEVRLSSYSRESLNVDDVRNKAYGSKEEEKKRIDIPEVKEEKPIVEEDDDDTDLLVDLSKDNDKPSVKEVTMGDALEYFQDLGLEYNVDYLDASKEKASGRRVKDYDDNSEMFSISNNEEEKKEELKFDEDIKPPVVSVDNVDGVDVENDDNLFDLIDSMYDEEK